MSDTARQFQHRDGEASNADVVRRIKRLIGSKDPKVIAAVAKANEGLLNCKLLTPSAVHYDATLTNLSVQYKNNAFVGLKMMPVIPVTKPSGRYLNYAKRDRLGTPDASVGTRSTPAEISEHRSFATYSCEPYALMDFLDDRTARSVDAPLNEMVELVAAVNDVMDLLEEIRIASVLTTAANYAGNTLTLAGATQWSAVGTSFPITDIQAAIDSLWEGPGATTLRGVCSPEVLSVLRNHATVRDQFKYTGSSLASPQQLATFLGLDELIVGSARVDTANEGQATAVYSRIWGKDFVIGRVSENPGIRQASFAGTFRFGQKVTSQWFDPKPGISGGYYGKVGMDEDHKIIAPDLGFVFKNVIP